MVVFDSATKSIHETPKTQLKGSAVADRHITLNTPDILAYIKNIPLKKEGNTGPKYFERRPASQKSEASFSAPEIPITKTPLKLNPEISSSDDFAPPVTQLAGNLNVLSTLCRGNKEIMQLLVKFQNESKLLGATANV